MEEHTLNKNNNNINPPKGPIKSKLTKNNKAIPDEVFIHDLYPVHIYKKNNETTKQFEFRKRLYDKIFNDIKNEERALIYSNMWINILSMGCTYPKDVMDMIINYRPADKDNIFV